MSDPKLDGLSEEERLAAEWAALADEGGDGGGGGDDMGGGTSTRVLNQDEIDSLLGFDLAGDGGGEQLRHPRDHQLGAGLLRAPADAGDRLRPPGAA